MKMSKLLALALVLLISVGTLAGSTIAWFTDTVTSANNIIKSGTLDAEMWYKDVDDTEWKDASTGAIFNYNNWEPGYTDVKELTVKNVGSLAFEYELNVMPAAVEGQYKLADVIEVYYSTSKPASRSDIVKAENLAGTISLPTGKAAGILLPAEGKGAANVTLPDEVTEVKGETTIWIGLHMQESAGNEYQGLSVGDGFAVQLLAKQYTYENDSFNNEYDLNADYSEDVWDGNDSTEVPTPSKDTDENGNEIDVIEISTAAELKALADAVNNGNSYDQYTIRLTQNINLGNREWIPIGTGTDGKHFSGIFDGQGHTVSNFTVNTSKYAGLFGSIRNSTEIKNLTVKNATISANDYAGGVVGWAYGNVTNCHAENVTVSTMPYWTGSNFDGGAKAGGVIGCNGEGTFNITGCSAKNVTITAYRDLGGVMGMLHWGGSTLSDCKAENVTLKYYKLNGSYDSNTPNQNAGTVLGYIRINAEKTASTANCTPAPNDYSVTEYVPVSVVTEPAAMKNILENGGTAVLANNMELAANETITITAGKTATLDLNGYTLSGTNTNTATHNFMFDANGGELTVKNGTVEFKHTGSNMGWNGAATIFDVTAGGKLNIQNATIINEGGTDMNFAIHLNNWGEVTLNVENSTIKSTYCAIRVFNSGYDKNNVTIKNSTIYSEGNRAFWVHNYIGDLDSSKHTDDAIKARLNFDIFNNNDNNNTFIAEKVNAENSPIRYGFNSSTYINVADGSTIQN